MWRPLAMALALAAPAAGAVDAGHAVGDVRLEIGKGCDADTCFPGEFAWVRAHACAPHDGIVLLEVERVGQESSPVVEVLEPHATGDPACAYLVDAFVGLWADLVDSPLDCVRATLVATGGAAGTRVACF